MIGDTCGRCGRPEWSPILGAIDGSCCTARAGHECLLVAQRDALVQVMKAMLDNPSDAAVQRTALMVLSTIVGESHVCPLCRTPQVVRRGSVRIHYPSNEATRPCEASFRRVQGGWLL